MESRISFLSRAILDSSVLCSLILRAEMAMSVDVLGKWGCGKEQGRNSACPSNVPVSLHPVASGHCDPLWEEQGEKGVHIPCLWFCTGSNLGFFKDLQIVIQAVLI